MRICHTILAVLVALSVAIPPAVAGFTTGGKTTEQSVSEIVPDCEHHNDQTNDTTPKHTDGCDSMAGCALKCFTITVVSYSSVSFLSAPRTAPADIRASGNISPLMGNPPFRPPRF
jgi:hypothetical protein